MALGWFSTETIQAVQAVARYLFGVGIIYGAGQAARGENAGVGNTVLVAIGAAIGWA